jgi:hypothetical protein
MIAHLNVVPDIARVYDQGDQDSGLIEIELDTQQLRALTSQDQAFLGNDLAVRYPDASGDQSSDLNGTLEALLRLSWPVWQGTPERPPHG